MYRQLLALFFFIKIRILRYFAILMVLRHRQHHGAVPSWLLLLPSCLPREISYLIMAPAPLLQTELSSWTRQKVFAAGEMKHGSIALIGEHVPVIFLCPKNDLFEKAASNSQEPLARGKNIIVITDEDVDETTSKSVRKVNMPNIQSALAPFLYSITLQLLVHHTVVLRETDADRLRNLAKSMTVE